MRQAGEGLRVLEVARMDVHRSGSDVRRWVRGKEDLDIGIRKENIFVTTGTWEVFCQYVASLRTCFFFHQFSHLHSVLEPDHPVLPVVSCRLFDPVVQDSYNGWCCR